MTARKLRSQRAAAAQAATAIVAIVGRPNVGKSTLFNRLTGRRRALVDDQPGVTRDRRYAPAAIGDMHFIACDTAGFEEAKGDSLEARMREQTERAVDEAHLVLLVIDARAGVTPLDKSFAQWLRRKKTPVLLVANKAEAMKAAQAGLAEAFRLGFGAPIAVAAEHGEGLGDLADAMAPLLPEAVRAEPEISPRDATDWAAIERAAQGADGDEPLDEEAPAEAEAPDRPITLAIVGRPNVGKSTLLNRLLDQERVLVGPEAGITRDAIAVDWQWRGRALRLVDTAGLRRRSKIEDKIEKLSAADTLEAIRFADICILLLDAEVMLEKQDLAVARWVAEEGRGLVIAANKWDAVENKSKAIEKLRDRIEESLPQVKGLPVVPISAKIGQNLDRLIQESLELYEVWNRRISTNALNRWLEGAVDNHPAPLVAGRRLRPRYMTQVKSRPPTFALFMNRAEKLPEDYQRYLTNGIRATFKLPGVPLRFVLRQAKNPFAEKKKRG